MDIQLKEMKLTFTVEGGSLTRTVSDLQGNVIWECITPDATEVDRSEEGLNAYQEQMLGLPFWNIVEVERIVL